MMECSLTVSIAIGDNCAMLPTMTALRVFDAAARTGSCSAAADEVCLTQGAVSKQIKTLEQTVGAALFVRTSRGLVLTQAGALYHEEIRPALEGLRAAQARIDALRAPGTPLRLHILPILGDRWLMPRFPDFARRHPALDVQFTTFVSAEDAEEPDAMLRFGDGDWPGSLVDYLFGREVVLVASPDLVARHGGIGTVADLGRMTLLQHFQTPDLWTEFAEAAGARGVAPAHVVRYGFFGVMIQAAIAGLGIALVPEVFVAGDLAAGRLVNPLQLRCRSRNGYYLTVPLNRPASPALLAFREWLLAEAAQSGDSPAGSPRGEGAGPRLVAGGLIRRCDPDTLIFHLHSKR